MRPYVLNRMGRALVASGIVYTATEQVNILPIAVTEFVSVGYEISYILPYFGNILWLILLFPNITNVYSDVFLYKKKEDNLQEQKYIILCILSYLYFYVASNYYIF